MKRGPARLAHASSHRIPLPFGAGTQQRQVPAETFCQVLIHFLDELHVLRGDVPAVAQVDALGLGPQVKAYDFPEGEWRRVRKAEGYRWILVNGEVTFQDGVCSGDTPGRLLRHGVA